MKNKLTYRAKVRPPEWGRRFRPMPLTLRSCT